MQAFITLQTLDQEVPGSNLCRYTVCTAFMFSAVLPVSIGNKRQKHPDSYRITQSIRTDSCPGCQKFSHVLWHSDVHFLYTSARPWLLYFTVWQGIFLKFILFFSNDHHFSVSAVSFIIFQSDSRIYSFYNSNDVVIYENCSYVTHVPNNHNYKVLVVSSNTPIK